VRRARPSLGEDSHGLSSILHSRVAGYPEK
jgi:hypothetical protein